MFAKFLTFILTFALPFKEDIIFIAIATKI